MHYLLFYEKVSDATERQKPHQAAHLEHVRQAARTGELILAGSLADPEDGAAVLLFESASPASAEAFAAADPYVCHGIISRWRVRAWHTVAGAAKKPGKPL
jgi:uncharacterized protein YciI